MFETVVAVFVKGLVPYGISMNISVCGNYLTFCM